MEFLAVDNACPTAFNLKNMCNEKASAKYITGQWNKL